MILKIVVLLGIAIYLALNGLWLLAALAVVSIVPRIGLFTALLLAVFLFVNRSVWPGLIVSGLIAFNLIGNYLLDPKRKLEREMDKLSRRGANEARVYKDLCSYSRRYLSIISGLQNDKIESLFRTRDFLLVLEEILKSYFVDRGTDAPKGMFTLLANTQPGDARLKMVDDALFAFVSTARHDE